MPERAASSPEQSDSALKAPERAQFLKLYKSATYLTFANLPFSGDKTNPLIAKLQMIQKHRLNSVPGTTLIEFYNDIKDKLDQEHPIIRRVFIGEMLRRLKTQGESSGFVEFIRLVINETKTLQPLLVKHIKELISIIQTMPPSPFKEKMINELFNYGGIKKPDSRPEDPLFGEGSDSREGGTTDDYGLLEGVDTYIGGGEIMDQSKLDPFQLILYKRLMQAYNEFATRIINKLQPLFVYHHLRNFKKQVYRAIYDLGQWIAETVKQMSINNVGRFESIYKARISALKLPSLPYSASVPAPFWAKIHGKTRHRINQLQAALTNIRSKVENEVKGKLMAGLGTIKDISQFVPLISKELARKKMFRAGPNRTFLNRFWTLAYRKFQNSKGDERLKYEFLTMILDSIKDDNELVAIKDRIKPLFIAVLKFSPDAQRLSKKYFGKDFNKLSTKEIDEIINLLLPSRTLTVREKQSKEYKDMLIYLKSILVFKVGLEDIKQTNYPVYIALITLSHNLINIYTSLARERDIRKAKKKIAEFVGGFEAIKKLLGREGLRKLEKKSPALAALLKNPKQVMYKLKNNFLASDTVKRVLSEFERIHNLKQPPVVKVALERVEKIERELLKDEKHYKEIRDKAFARGVLDYAAIRNLQAVRDDLKKVQEVINMLTQTTDTQTFKLLVEPIIKEKLYSTRYLSVNEETQKNMSFTVAEEAKRLKEDYDNLFYIANIVQAYVNKLIRYVYSKRGLAFASSKVSPVVENIILTYGYRKQKENSGKSAYSFLKNPVKRKEFVQEIVTKVNGFLRTAKITDNKHNVVPIMYMTGTFPDLIDKYISTRIIPKAKRARPT